SALRLRAGGPAWRPGQGSDGGRRTTDGGRSAAHFRLPSVVRRPPSFLPRPALLFLRAGLEFAHRHRRALTGALLAGAVALWLLSGIYLVPARQVGVVQRFGELVAAGVPRGLHSPRPWPAEVVTLVDVAGVRRVEIGFRSANPAGDTARADRTSPTGSEELPSEWSTRHSGRLRPVPEEALLLTGDEYMVDATLTLQYR